MSTHIVTVYGPGGYDAEAPDGNVVEEYVMDNETKAIVEVLVAPPVEG